MTALKLPSGPGVEERLELPAASCCSSHSSALGLGGVMAAAGADGVSVIEGAACEPEVVSTADFLRTLGVKIEGDGSPTIRIEGVGQDGFASLGGVSFTIPPDRIETGTYILAGAAAGGRVEVRNCRPKDNLALLSILKNIGVPLEIGEDSVTVTGVDQVTPCDVATLAYPGFPTDLQGPLMALLCKTDGVSLITEKIFPDRFMHLSELRRFGAKVRKEGSTGIIEGGAPLHGAEVMASDLRASACLVIAGLIASGTTQVRRIYHLQRGYESMEVKLRGLGADVERVGRDRGLRIRQRRRWLARHPRYSLPPPRPWHHN